MLYSLIVQLIDDTPHPNSFGSTLIMMILGIPIRIFSSYNIIRSFQLLR